MSLNQQLREPRVLGTLTPRLIALTAFIAAALLLVSGCRSAPGTAQDAPPPVAAEQAVAADRESEEGHPGCQERLAGDALYPSSRHAGNA